MKQQELRTGWIWLMVFVSAVAIALPGAVLAQEVTPGLDIPEGEVQPPDPIGSPEVAAVVIEVKTVRFEPTNPLSLHPTWSGNTLTLRGTANVQGANIQFEWDFGDPPAANVTGNVSNRFVIEATHAYSGSVGDVFTATLTVTDTSTGDTGSAPYRVVIEPLELNTEVNVAIEDGLWYLHKTMRRFDQGGLPFGDWQGGGRASSGNDSNTAANLLAFEVSGYLENGAASDPYTETVQRGMHAILGNMLRSVGIPATDNNGLGVMIVDNNGNGLGVRTREGRELYQGGMFMDALVASGTPAAVAATGPAGIVGRRYDDIVQDMVDYYHLCQYDGGAGGGWRYTCDTFPDNSANQWAAIGMIPAERNFSLTVQQRMKDWNEVWINFSQASNGSCGYTSRNPVWGPYAVTPSCMVQMAMDGIGRGDGRWDKAETFLRDRFANGGSASNAIKNYYYGLFSYTKAMLLHDPDGNLIADPIVLTQSQTAGVPPLDWYSAEASAGDPTDGVARTLVGDQNAAGWWQGHNFAGQHFSFETGWAIVMLRRTVTDPQPVAVVTGVPNPTQVDLAVTLDCSQSFHLDPEREIATYEWDLDNDGVFDDAVGFQTSVTYDLVDCPQLAPPTPTPPCLKVVSCRVTDDGGANGDDFRSDDESLEITVTVPPIPPTADADGPYLLCPQSKPWFVDGSGSVNPDEGISVGVPTPPGDTIQSYAWDLDDTTSPSTVDAGGVQPDVTAFYEAAGPGDYLATLTVTDTSATSFPNEPGGDLSDTDTAEVRVLDALDDICSNCETDRVVVTAESTGLAILVSWVGPVAAPGYAVTRATNPGGPFTQIAQTSATSFLDTNVVPGPTYFYVVWTTRLNGDRVCQSSTQFDPGEEGGGASATVCENPVAVCQGANVPADATCVGSVTVNEVDGGSTPVDPPACAISRSADPTTGLPLGPNLVTLSVSNIAGSDSCVATVTVIDVTPPTITPPDPLTLFCIREFGIDKTDPRIVAWLATASGSDLCQAVVISDDAPAVLLEGTTTVTFTATDESGNSTSATSTVTATDCVCDPDPRTQGYWNRQCLGADLIQPGRNGRGPQEPLEPDFVKTLVPAVDAVLEATLFQFNTCEDGIQTIPASDKCEQATKQYTSLLLNLESRKVVWACPIDVSASGCSATTIFELLDEVVGLILTGDNDSCNQAKSCLDSVNRGDSILEAALVVPPDAPDTSNAPDTSDTPSEPPAEPTTALQGIAKQPVASDEAATEPVATEAPEAVIIPVLPVVQPSGLDVEPEALEPTAEEALEPLEALERYMATLAAKASAETKAEAEDALLTALSGGYEPEVRFRVVRALVGKVDAGLHSLLVEHLESIRSEAVDFGKDELAYEAERLLKSLERTE